jgi:hypothetical protein
MESASHPASGSALATVKATVWESLPASVWARASALPTVSATERASARALASDLE